jgi:hypothetical protein
MNPSPNPGADSAVGASELDGIHRLSGRLWTIPADDEVVDNFANTLQLSDCFADVDVIPVDSDDSFEADAVVQSPNDQRSNVETFFGQQGSTNIRFQLVGGVTNRKSTR